MIKGVDLIFVNFTPTCLVIFNFLSGLSPICTVYPLVQGLCGAPDAPHAANVLLLNAEGSGVGKFKEPPVTQAVSVKVIYFLKYNIKYVNCKCTLEATLVIWCSQSNIKQWKFVKNKYWFDTSLRMQSCDWNSLFKCVLQNLNLTMYYKAEICCQSFKCKTRICAIGCDRNHQINQNAVSKHKVDIIKIKLRWIYHNKHKTKEKMLHLATKACHSF